MENKIYGDLFTTEEFAEHIFQGTITDYDGFGEWSDGEHTYEILDSVDAIFDNPKPNIYTYVMWYNK
jgi:hypothetical protein